MSYSRCLAPNLLSLSLPLLHAHAVIVSGPKPGTIVSDRRVPGVEIVEGDAVLGSNIVAAVARLRLVKDSAPARHARLNRRRRGHRRCARGARLGRGRRRRRCNRAGARERDARDAVGDVELEVCAVGVDARVERDELGHGDVVLCLDGVARAAAADSVPLVAVGRSAGHGLRRRGDVGRGGGGG